MGRKRIRGKKLHLKYMREKARLMRDRKSIVRSSDHVEQTWNGVELQQSFSENKGYSPQQRDI